MVISYVGKKLRINLINNFYYIGCCLDQTETKITILDKNKREVLIDMNNILVLEVLD